MQTYVAEIGELVRAQRRDEEEIDSLQDRISRSTVRAVPSLGARFLFVLVHAVAPIMSQFALQALKVYKFLGYLTLAQTALSLIIWMVSSLEEERNQAKNTPAAMASRAKKDVPEQDDV
ncbi:hypothetical protein TELCIR_19562, partial [Teladorsagia circumcincta]